MKKRKLYEKPAMQEFELKHRAMLMAGSPAYFKDSIDDWNNGDTTDDDIFM